jgi:multidrug efflux pump subunit AcrA (membrane-fusion protein)
MNNNNKKRNTKLIVLSVVAVLIVALILFYYNKPDSSSSSDYTSEISKKGDIITYYSFSGNMKSKDEKQIIADKIVKIKEFNVKEGDIVQAGDVLYTVDISDMDANLEQAAAAVELAQINYDNAKDGMADQQLLQLEAAVSSAKLSYDDAAKNLDRIQAVYDEGGISEQSFEQAKTQCELAKQQYETAVSNYDLAKDKQINVSIETAEAQLKQAQAAYEAVKKQAGDPQVMATFSGEVKKIYASENVSTMAGSPIMDIADYSEMKAVVKVDEYDLGAVSEGKEVTVKVDALDKEYKGVITKISKEATTGKTAGALQTSLNEISYYLADVAVEDGSDLYTGMSVEVKVLNQSVKDTVVISMKALQFDNTNNPFVYCKDENGEISPKQIQIGINDGLQVQITEGIREGEEIFVPANVTPVMSMDMMGGE